MKNLLPQIIGLVAVITFLLSYQQKKRIHIIILNATSRVLYILQYLLLGAFSGAALDVLGTVSSVLAGRMNTGRIQKHKKAVFLSVNFLIALTGGLIAFQNKSWLDILPIIGVLFHTSAFWISDEKTIRRVSLLGSPFWFVYNLLNNAYGSALGDILSICSIVIAMIRYKKPQSLD